MLLMDDDTNFIKNRLSDSIETKRKILSSPNLVKEIGQLAIVMAETLVNKNKILLCGNGGSASDALHIAGEIVGRFQMERKGYSAIALNADVATMTAISNDYGYEQVFSRQVEALMRKGDILIGISTSGNSPNIIRAFEKAHELSGQTALLSGKNGGRLKEISDYCIVIPSDVTARIQESHMCIYHIMCEMVEGRLHTT